MHALKVENLWEGFNNKTSLCLDITKIEFQTGEDHNTIPEFLLDFSDI
jgi:hypothetical protein